MNTPRILLPFLLLGGTGLALGQPTSIPSPSATPRPRISPSPLGRQNPGEMRFKGMDKNNDGKISRDEWRGNERSFEKKDTDGDGVLSGNELLPAATKDPSASPSPSPSPKT
jgi:hypothetical protein